MYLESKDIVHVWTLRTSRRWGMPCLAGNHHHRRAMQATWVKATVADPKITRLGSQSCHNLFAVATKTRAEVNISCNVRLSFTWTASILQICCSQRAKKNIMFDSYSLTLLFFASAIVLLYHSLTRLLLTLHFLPATVSQFTSTIFHSFFLFCWSFT